jgi:alpha-L-rhamnosidase
MWTVSCDERNDGLSPVELQCEYQTNPVGIDVPAPRFSWKLSDPAHVRGQAQTAYHILMASSPEQLTEEAADVWNSGKVASSQSFLVPYGGTELHSSSPCFWKVKVYDKDDRPSKWSETAKFVTGILDEAEWEAAAWIRHPDALHTKHIWFRKNLRLVEAPGQVFMHVASIGYHELYINGKKADNRVLAPALTNLDKRLFYVTYDIADFLVEGDNTVGIWFAAGWASYDCFSRTPALRVLLSGQDADGHAIVLASDETWRCAESCSEDTREVRTYNNNGGEIVDARRALPEWNLPGFDDSRWATAAVAAGNGDVKLTAHDIPPSLFTGSLTAERITDTGRGTYKIDFGQCFTGWIELGFHGLAAGDTVVIGVADDEKSFSEFNIINYFVSAGVEGERFCNRFNYVAGRYVNVRPLRQKPERIDCVAHVIATGMLETGEFSSGSKLLQDIRKTDLWTFLVNTTEGYTSDCPHRERCGYGEVATATSWGIGLTTFDAGAFYRNVVRNWRDVQTPEGWGRNTAPQPNDEHWGGAMWSSAGMNVAWEHYLHYGDPGILEIIYPTAVKWLEFLHAHTRDGLLVQYRPHPGQFLGDWLAPGSRNEFGESSQAQYFNNCVYAMNLETFVAMAKKLGRPDDATLYAERLHALRPAIHKRFYNPQTGLYMDGTQVQQAFALLTGVAPEEVRERVEKTIVDDLNGAHPYFDMGSSGLYVLLQYLTGHPELAQRTYEILCNTSCPGYAYFLNQGETAWPEDWKIDVDSKMHTCYTGITGWMVKALCGLQPGRDGEGYRHFIFKPQIVEEVGRVAVTSRLPFGTVEAKWEFGSDGLSAGLTVPPNTSATVYLDTACFKNIHEGATPFEDAEGVTARGVEGRYHVINVVSGKYLFTGAVAAKGENE